MISVTVGLPGRSYEVTIGSGASKLLAASLPRDTRRAAIVSQQPIDFHVEPGMEFETFLIPDGEEAKSIASVEELLRGLARSGVGRRDVVVAVGGGVVTDVAGFAAGVYLRGVRYVNVATTLLAQVDAAIGGKTGVNLPEGKNLVGAFWQPLAVFCDTDSLQTLPAREWTSGRGEVAKCAFLGKLLRGRSGAPDDMDPRSVAQMPLEQQIARCVAIKATVVAADEREGEERALLNYGHTLAHALEAEALASGSDDPLRHGEAVGIGLMFAAHLAKRMGRIDDVRVELHRQVLEAMRLPRELPPDSSAARLLAYMARDKKARHDLTFVLDGDKGVEVVHEVESSDVLATLAGMGSAP